MKINYDKDADAIYIQFSKGKFQKNQKVDDFLILDMDSDDNILGIEILDASKRIQSDSIKEISVNSK